MKNPYEVLGIKQDASAIEINQGFNTARMLNLKTGQHSQPELAAARQQLLSPPRRLVADFMYPARPRAKRPKVIAWLGPGAENMLPTFALNVHDSL